MGEYLWPVAAIVGGLVWSRFVSRWQDDREKEANARLELEREKLSALRGIQGHLEELVNATMTPAAAERRAAAELDALKAKLQPPVKNA